MQRPWGRNCGGTGELLAFVTGTEWVTGTVWASQGEVREVGGAQSISLEEPRSGDGILFKGLHKAL